MSELKKDIPRWREELLKIKREVEELSNRPKTTLSRERENEQTVAKLQDK